MIGSFVRFLLLTRCEGSLNSLVCGVFKKQNEIYLAADIKNAISFQSYSFGVELETFSHSPVDVIIQASPILILMN